MHYHQINGFEKYIFSLLFLQPNFSYRIDVSIGINIKFKGKGNVHWTEQKRETHTVSGERRTRTVTKHYRNDEQYFETKFHLFGTGEPLSLIKQTLNKFSNDFKISGERCELAAGEYSFEFSFVLPHCLPSSFTGEYGKITFKAKATVDLPWAIDIECKKEFIVQDHVSLNDLPQAIVSILNYYMCV